MTTSAIGIERVSRRFFGADGSTSLLVLDNIDLEVLPGEFVSLVGASGCGKTTLLKMVAGLVHCEEGEIRIHGQPVRGVPLNVGFVFQEPGLLPWRSVVGNIELALKRKKLSRQAKRSLIERYLDATGLSDFADYPPYKLSGGMQQRVGLARALAVDPEVLLMDEPFGALDALTRAALQVELGRIVANVGTSVLFVTHDVDEAIFLSDRVAIMGTRPGRIRSVVPIPGSRPRSRAEFTTNPEYLRLRAQILGLIEGAPGVDRPGA